jgi:hypothetical protein
MQMILHYRGSENVALARSGKFKLQQALRKRDYIRKNPSSWDIRR